MQRKEEECLWGVVEHLLETRREGGAVSRLAKNTNPQTAVEHTNIWIREEHSVHVRVCVGVLEAGSARTISQTHIWRA